MVYIKEIKYSKPLKNGTTIEFILGDIYIQGDVVKAVDGFFINIYSGLNDKVFKILDIDNPTRFVDDIVGYNTSGTWPEVKNTEDLEKVLDALMKVNRPSITTGKLNIKINKSVKLNFKL